MTELHSGPRLGVSGRLAGFFMEHRLTPLLALVALLLGTFALWVTPREEDPQIDVTMANVLIPFPGASARDVERMVAGPAEEALSRVAGIDHVMSLSRPGMAILTAQFRVGVPHTTALVRLYNTVESHRDWFPRNLGVLPPVVKSKGIDDVPIVALTLYRTDGQGGAYDVERVAHSIESDLKRVPGVREVTTIGGPGRAVMVEMDPARMAGAGITVANLRAALQAANEGGPIGALIAANHSVAISTGPFLRDAQDAANLIVGVKDGHPVYLDDVATVRDGPAPPERYVWYADDGGNVRNHSRPWPEYPAVTIAVTKKPGENAIQVADAVMRRAAVLRNTVIPADVHVTETRNYGKTANDKAKKLIEKLLFATASVVALVYLAMGRREALIVGSAVILTLTVTLFASWAWGFTLNRVSLFALIFSIGILVDDAIVVVENIHRHHQRFPGRSLAEIIPGAVDEVGGPTILATLTVIAALLPMAFVTGLMGPYMSPIPINASMGMMLSLAIAFVVTPWLALRWMKGPVAAGGEACGTEHEEVAVSRLTAMLAPMFVRVFRPLLDPTRGRRNRRILWGFIAILIAISVALPVAGLVILKMLPFDNKSEFQVVVDMPAGTPLEKTAAVLHEMGAYLATVPEVVNYQAYAGTASPINFNGLVRQYYLRAGGNVGDIEVNLLGNHERKTESHAIALRVRPPLDAIARRFGANVKIVEVPPGPPVLAPIVAEIYGPTNAGRIQVAKAVRAVFERTRDIVDVDDSSIAPAPKIRIDVDRRKAALLGIPESSIVRTLRTALHGDSVTYLHDGSKYPVPVEVRLPQDRRSGLHSLLQMRVRSAAGQLVPIGELVTIRHTTLEQPIYHKDLLPVNYVVGDMAGKIDSPLYGMFRMRPAIAQIRTPGGGSIAEYFIRQPAEAYSGYAMKWDGEWQITYETFRDMGIAYAVGLVLIYLLVVAQFGSYLTPLIIMAPIPLTVIGVLPGHAMGHAIAGAQFTATSMIGMIALAGIIVRNSILLVDFVHVELRAGVPFDQAIVRSAITRAQPIVLTGMAAMLGALFILDDPIFNGLAISLIFGILVSTVLTLIVIPTLYYAVYREKYKENHREKHEGEFGNGESSQSANPGATTGHPARKEIES